MRVVRRLAESPLSEVLLVEAASGDQLVKKRLRAELAGTAIAAQFLADARLACGLAHPNVVRTLEAGLEEDGAPYLVMEWLDGVDLRRAMKSARARGDRVAASTAFAVGARIARGLAYAHELDDGGLVHRDVSPHNVVLTARGEVKLIDFDNARTPDGAPCAAVTGKLPYMAPEQIEGLALDARTDLFGLGVILWELVTGQRLFKRETERDTALAVREASALPPSAVDRALPAIVDRPVLALLAKFACSRPARARDVAAELDALAAALGLAGESAAAGAIGELVERTRASEEAGDARTSLY